jgi:DNA mismatch repair protein MutS
MAIASSFSTAPVPGGADRSYGVHVARLAGVPGSVTSRASEILRELEGQPQPAPAGHEADVPVQDDELRKRLLALELERMTPLEALTELHALQREAGER